MSTKKLVNTPEENEAPEIKQVTPEKGEFDMAQRYKVKITEDAEAHHYKKGDEIETSKTLADKIEANNWGKILGKVAMTLMLLAFFAIGANAQRNLVGNKFYSPYTTGAAITNPFMDSVVNTATSVLSLQRFQKGTGTGTTVVQVVYSLLSGTGAGTGTLQVSLDGVNWVTAPSTSAVTVTNVAKQSFMWNITGAPYTWYRISTTGAGTEVLTQVAYIYQY